MNLVTDPVNLVKPQFMDLGISTINTLNKDAGLWRPATRVRRSTGVSHWRAPDHVVGESTAVGDAVSEMT